MVDRAIKQVAASVSSAAVASEPAVSGRPRVTVGSFLRADRPADRFLLSDQFLLKSIMLTLHELPNGVVVAAVRRPMGSDETQTGKPRRRPPPPLSLKPRRRPPPPSL